MNWLGPSVVAFAALLLFLNRRGAASLQGNVFGGRILPGCVIAEAIALLLLAALMLLRG